MEYMLLCKEWWDHHLKSLNTNAMDNSLLRVYLQDMILPSSSPPEVRNGKWIQMSKHETGHHRFLIPDGINSTCLLGTTDRVLFRKMTQTAGPSILAGLAMPDWLSFGDNSEAVDQQLADAQSLSWTSGVLQETINILGNPELRCSVSADKDQACLAVRLMHVFPDGKSTLITFGVLNLTHRNGHATQDVAALIPGKKYDVSVEMRAISYVIPIGHKIRLAISSTYFPMIWPSRENAKLEIVTGSENGTAQTFVKIPIFPADNIPPESSQIVKVTENPKLGPPLPTHILRPGRYHKYSVCGLSKPDYKYVVDVDHGRVHLLQTGTIMDSHIVNTYSIEEDNPLSATGAVEGYMKIEYPDIDGGIITCADFTSKLWSDYNNFHTYSTLLVSLNGKKIHSKTWKKTIPRFYV